MLSNKNIKFINSLQKKKNRDSHGLYIVEGDKLVREILQSDSGLEWLIAKPEWISGIPDDQLEGINNVIPVTYNELKKVSTLKSPHNSLALVKIRQLSLRWESICNELSLVLDFVQDPGNMGTIVRIAAWFGIKTIICSENCVDIYNPKVVQSTMGALLHVDVIYTDLSALLKKASDTNLPVFATSLDGESVYDSELENRGLILFGNESRGITAEFQSMVTKNLLIPAFGTTDAGLDSLNVAMSAAIICSEFRRRFHSSK
jgi:TrmH family RNA methyltransferase